MGKEISSYFLMEPKNLEVGYCTEIYGSLLLMGEFVYFIYLREFS